MTHDPIESLLDQMTLQEQVALLSGADFWTTVPVPRLNVPAVKVSDGPNGARGGIFKDGPSTACFPAGIALAATWNPGLVQQAGAALGQEALLKGARVLLAPTVNLQRTLFNGRNFECHSEDPWLSSELAVAYVRGVQSQGVAATIKHFVGNESEYQRMTMSSDIPERALRELYLLPFERAVKEAGVWAVMTSYNRLDGTFAADHRRLVTQVLREEWGFDGLVMTDWFAGHDTVLSVQAGTDLEMPGPARERGDKLIQAVNQGRLPAQAVRDCARRVLRLMQRVGSLQDPVIPAERADDLPAHRALIRELGAQGCVLLKNECQTLPLEKTPGARVALIGSAALVPQIMGGGSATVNAHYRIAPIDALRAQWPQASFTHSVGADIHRWVPVLHAPVTIEYFDSPDLDGPVVQVQQVDSTEQMWTEHRPEGVSGQHFSARARLDYVAQQSGHYQFSLISAGRSRAFINGQLAVDAWSGWSRGETYFTFGCDEVVHARDLQAGETCQITIEYSSATPEPIPLRALRFGAHRVLGEPDIAAAVQAASDADLAVVFAGLNAEWDNEGLDRHGLELPQRQNELIARVVAANPRTVVVLQTGSPVTLPWLDAVPAVLQAWYPGQECGNSIADVLLGAAEPGGRLTQSWPLRESDSVAFGQPLNYPGQDGHVRYDEGLFIGYRHYQQHGLQTLFPFGHGLSYTEFEYGPLRGLPSRFQAGDSITVEVPVRNTGRRAGQAVVQLYVQDEACSVARPPRELKGFAKLQLEAGESGLARLTLTMRAFAFFDDRRAAWVAEAGRFQLQAGVSVDQIMASATVELDEDWIEPA
ncbi:glycoside hydrolase family 3 C-terminal domain-containing protein [Malikia spinosa]|uniref:Beta-D-glucoside glucohydrolase n=1 Tax=Malikia spinosa TaxID=86180 RepID=A0A7C9N9J8_9BURK|nr:glycoside hydrolase family 3 C-terminal domain-containing protein [Malikia spinosa]MYZ53062.1 beta-glucosidase [Malikia spinosa]